MKRSGDAMALYLVIGFIFATIAYANWMPDTRKSTVTTKIQPSRSVTAKKGTSGPTEFPGKDGTIKGQANGKNQQAQADSKDSDIKGITSRVKMVIDLIAGVGVYLGLSMLYKKNVKAIFIMVIALVTTIVVDIILRISFVIIT